MEVRVPDLGNFKDVAVIDVLVKPGDTIAIGHPAGHPRVRQGGDGRALHGERVVERSTPPKAASSTRAI